MSQTGLVKLTGMQRQALNALRDGPLKTGEIAVKIPYETWDSVHGRMRRLEDREFVRRIGYPMRWELTAAGREAIDG
jgi:DNA-binding HxlR family transcriptional regulator